MTPVWKCPSRQVCLVSASQHGHQQAMSSALLLQKISPINLAFYGTWRLATCQEGGWRLVQECWIWLASSALSMFALITSILCSCLNRIFSSNTMCTSNMILQTPSTELQRINISELMACPPPPRATRRDLLSHLRTNHVHSIFAPLPFDCTRSRSSASTETRALKPRPIFGTEISSFNQKGSLLNRQLEHETMKSDSDANSEEPVRRRSLVSMDETERVSCFNSAA
jgi:hypothetical protein